MNAKVLIEDYFATTDVLGSVAEIVTIAISNTSETKVTYVEPRFHCETASLQ